MSIAAVVCRGYGPAASIPFVVTRGFSLGAAPVPPTPPPPPQPSGGIDYEHYRRIGRTADQEEAERRRQRVELGLEEPPRRPLTAAEKSRRRAALAQAGIAAPAAPDRAAQDAALAAESADLAARDATAAIEARARKAAREQAATDRATAMTRQIANEAARRSAADDENAAAILLLLG